MGQPIVVLEKPTSEPGVVRFDINRSLTGMGHERYRSRADATGHRPPDELARRLFDHEPAKVESVHIYSNSITLQLGAGGDPSGIADVIRELYIHYKDGVEPAKF